MIDFYLFLTYFLSKIDHFDFDDNNDLMKLVSLVIWNPFFKIINA